MKTVREVVSKKGDRFRWGYDVGVWILLTVERFNKKSVRCRRRDGSVVYVGYSDPAKEAT